MGAKHSKLPDGSLLSLETNTNNLGAEMETLQSTLKDLSESIPALNDFQSRLKKVEEEQNANNQKLTELLDLGRDQQQVISDLGDKYSQLYEDFCKQQKMLVEMTGKYEDKFHRCEEKLFETKSKIFEIEKEVESNSEFKQILGIRKTENMIKKEKFNVKNLLGDSYTQRKSVQNEAKQKVKEKLQNARDQRKLRGLNTMSNQEALAKGDPLQEVQTQEAQANKSSAESNQKSDGQENLLELNINNLQF